MYKYEFVRVEMTGSFSSKPKENYQEIIRTYARNGWKFKQIFAPAISGYGKAVYYELIFEKAI